jgi:hypothetical protein
MTGCIEILSEGVEDTIDRIHSKYMTRAGLEMPAVDEALAYDDVVLRFVPEHGSEWDLRDDPGTVLSLERGEFEPLEPVHSGASQTH